MPAWSRGRGAIFTEALTPAPYPPRTHSHGSQAKKEGGCLNEGVAKIGVQEPGGLNVDENWESRDIAIPPGRKSAKLGTWGPGLEKGAETRSLSWEGAPGQPQVLTQAGWGFSGQEGGNWGCSRSWAGREQRLSSCKEKPRRWALMPMNQTE